MAFFNLTELESLDLSYKNITEITSSMLAPLANVYSLGLSFIFTLLDKALFVNNVNLRYLYLQHNDMREIDGRIFNP